MIRKLFSKIFGARSNKSNRFEKTSILTSKEVQQKSGPKNSKIQKPVDYSNLSRVDQLFKAISLDDKARVDTIIEEGIDKPDEKGWTLLMTACDEQNFEAAKILVERGADVNKSNDAKLTPLWLATIEKIGFYGKDQSEELAMLLINNGAKINAKTMTGSTALHNLIEQYSRFDMVKGKYPLIQFFIENGANPYIRDKDGEYPLDIARKNDLARIVNILDKEGKSIGNDDPKALIQAIKDERHEIVKLLLKRNIDINHIEIINTSGLRGPGITTALIEAIKKDNFKLVSLLIKKGAKVNSYGTLSIATTNGNVKIVNLLIRKGADLNQSWMGFSPLEGAIVGCAGAASVGMDTTKFEKVVKLLIKAGADISQTTHDGRSFIQAASSYGCRGIVRVLLSG